MSRDGFAELGLGEQEEVVLAAAPDDERRDQPCLRRQEERLARCFLDVVRDHPLEEVLGVRSLDRDVRPWAEGDDRSRS